MKLGTIIEFQDGRTATVVFNGLVGVGVKWGEWYPDPKDFAGTTGGFLDDTVPGGGEWGWEPQALLRDPWDGCERCGFSADECVGTDYEIIYTPEQEVAA